MSKFGEPLSHSVSSNDANRYREAHHIVTSDGRGFIILYQGRIVAPLPNTPECSEFTNRMVDCHNACADIPAPAAFMANVKDLIEAAREVIDNIVGIDGDELEMINKLGDVVDKFEKPA